MPMESRRPAPIEIARDAHDCIQFQQGQRDGRIVQVNFALRE